MTGRRQIRRSYYNKTNLLKETYESLACPATDQSQAVKLTQDHSGGIGFILNKSQPKFSGSSILFFKDLLLLYFFS